MSNWFGVKTLYRWEAVGEPNAVDGGFDRDATLLEERVVIFRADSLDDAIEKAEGEALGYSEESYKNFYGQTVQLRYLGCCEAYDIGEDLIEDGVEVFSSRESVPESVADSLLVDNRFGREEFTTKASTIRDKFWNAELN
ncbi:MAG: DUF4288 domain-containing protein [bacterium]|nr:DUF4288 domain-containing protein [bacterium]